MPHALIVEDEPEANKLLSLLVQLRGYQTQSAFNGAEALSKVEREPPDVVLLDLMLPDVNGYEVCRRIKNRKATVLIPVVIVTARVTVENRLQSYNHGADGYVAKPYTPDQIFEALQDAERWRNALPDHFHAGSFPVCTADEGETFRSIARLRNILLARTPLDADAVARLARLLEWIAARAGEWGVVQGITELGSLSYRVLDDRVEIRLHDTSGCFAAEYPPEVHWAAELADAGVGRVDSDPTRREITVVRRFETA
ncbi:MAG: response regulator [Isosphaeraceae bacterium]